MFLCSSGSIGSYWPANERAKIAVFSFSSSSDVWEQKHSLFIYMCFKSWTYLHLVLLVCSLSRLFLLCPFFQRFALYICLTTLPNPPPAPSLVCRVHPSRQSGQPFVPAVVCVVSVVTRLWLAWTEMRPDCACGRQREVGWVMCPVSD